MTQSYDMYTVRHLRELIWQRNLIPKRWMLNYVKKKEAVTILASFKSADELPPAYIETIKKRNAAHRKKVYKSRKSRQEKFGATLSRDERLRLVINSADSLVFKERLELPEGFTSFLGSTRGKHAFVFVDANSVEYMFTKAEVQKLSSMGLYVPRGAMSSQPAQKEETTKRRLKDIFNDGQ